MNVKSIEKMMKANRLNLPDALITTGLKRLGLLTESKLKHYLTEQQLEDARFHCRVQVFNNQKHKLIARIGSSKDEALAKIGLALPLKSFKLST